jgi:hypothetical protein
MTNQVFFSKADNDCYLVRFLQNNLASLIYKNLKIKKDEIKIIIECYSYFCNSANSAYTFGDGRPCKNVSPRDAFNFFILSPKPTQWAYFNSIIIFTPKPGLFNETPPA